MAESNVKITFEIDGLEQSVTSIDDAKTALAGLENQAKKSEAAIEKTGDEIKNVAKETEKAGEAGEGAISVLDEATGGLASRFKNVFVGIGKMGTAMKVSFKAGIAGASGLKKALIATGVGAIVVALGLIVAYWDEIKAFVGGVSTESKKLLETQQQAVTAAEDQLAATQASESSLKLAGKSEKEIRDLKIEQTNEIITATLAVLEQQKAQKIAQIEAAERNQKIAAGIIGFLSLPITMLLGAVDALTYGLTKIGVMEEATSLVEGFTMGTASLIFDPEDAAEEGDLLIQETEKTLAVLQNKRDGFILKGNEDDKKASDARAQNARDLETELERLRAENIKGEEAKALALLEIERRKQEAELIAKGANNELLLELATNYELRKDEIEETFRLAREAKKAEEDAKAAENKAIVDEMLAQANLDSMEDFFTRAQAELDAQEVIDIDRITQAGATEAEIQRIRDGYDKKEKKLGEDKVKFDKALRNAEVNQALNAGAQVFDSMAELLGEGSAMGKAAAISSAVIQTYTGAQAAYASMVGVPFVGPVLAPIAAGIAVVAGVMNVKKIASTKTPGGKSVSAPSISAPSAPVYNPNTALAAANAGQTSDNEITTGEQASEAGPTVIKAFVVASDMTSQQEADANINDLARL
jgi:hypothetical protein